MHYKKSNFSYYLSSLFNILWWKFFPFNLEKRWGGLSESNKQILEKRKDYYIKFNEEFTIKSQVSLSSFKKDGGTTYYLDLKQLLVNFPKNKSFNYCFGDVTHIPIEPSFVKSRPIAGDNKNSVLLPLNSIRHFRFVEDKLSFSDKKNLAVWRGNAKQTHRQNFLSQHFNNPLCDIGEVQGINERVYYKPFLSVAEQLNYKFIFSIEGNDVATNLKWIMSSNSIAIMPKPKYETWFMEGMLIPDYHYIEIKDDYSDLDDKLKYYLDNPSKCGEIIFNANEYVNKFKNKNLEKLLSLIVIEKYFLLNR